jgi:hypothetical protein
MWLLPRRLLEVMCVLWEPIWVRLDSLEDWDILFDVWPIRIPWSDMRFDFMPSFDAARPLVLLLMPELPDIFAPAVEPLLWVVACMPPPAPEL